MRWPLRMMRWQLGSHADRARATASTSPERKQSGTHNSHHPAAAGTKEHTHLGKAPPASACPQQPTTPATTTPQPRHPPCPPTTHTSNTHLGHRSQLLQQGLHQEGPHPSSQPHRARDESHSHRAEQPALRRHPGSQQRPEGICLALYGLGQCCAVLADCRYGRQGGVRGGVEVVGRVGRCAGLGARTHRTWHEGANSTAYHMQRGWACSAHQTGGPGPAAGQQTATLGETGRPGGRPR